MQKGKKLQHATIHQIYIVYLYDKKILFVENGKASEKGKEIESLLNLRKNTNY